VESQRPKAVENPYNAASCPAQQEERAGVFSGQKFMLSPDKNWSPEYGKPVMKCFG
jgi:hypothetical protein